MKHRRVLLPREHGLDGARAHVGFIDDLGELVTDARRIAARYATGWFVVDLLASIPVELLAFSADIGFTGVILMLMRVLRLARLFRLRQLWQFVSRIQHTNAMRLVRLFFLFILMAHWTACLFYGIARMEMCARALRAHVFVMTLEPRDAATSDRPMATLATQSRGSK